MYIYYYYTRKEHVVPYAEYICVLILSIYVCSLRVPLYVPSY